jgi:protein-disulfide isomerase
MHEHLLRHHSALGDASLLAYAATLKLNVRTFADALDTHAYQPNVRAQFEGGRESGVHSTPTFFINGVRHDGDWDEETLTAVIERAARLVPA